VIINKISPNPSLLKRCIYKDILQGQTGYWKRE
jgi:hypothetical protein